VSEWWVLRPDQGGEVTGSDSFLDVSTCGNIKGTWCGCAPVEEVGPRTGCLQRGVFGSLRRHCAGKRNRFERDGFDLDLTYITSRVIAMSFPAVGVEAAYRNPRGEVVRFLEQHHGTAYRVYNLCEEKSHSDNGFPAHMTVRYPCADHCPPTLPMLADFCRDIQQWLLQDEQNVAVVHCKAGKGRTGTMICALLVYADAFPSAYDALVWFECRRGGERSGVTIPHQIRWIAMLERWLHHKDAGLTSNPMGDAEPHRLRALRFGPLPTAFWASESPSTGARSAERGMLVRVGLASRIDVQHGRVTFTYPDVYGKVDDSGRVEAAMPADGPIWRENDGLLRIEVLRPSSASCGVGIVRKRPKKKLELWWHHSFLQRREANGDAADGVEVLVVDVPKAWIGGLHKDMEKHKKTPADFTLTAIFDDLLEGAASECELLNATLSGSPDMCSRMRSTVV